MTTPAHFDCEQFCFCLFFVFLNGEVVHNVYCQLVGFKRFVLFAPRDFFNLYTFPALAPSSRMTQINFTDDSLWRSRFSKFLDVQAFEVVLAPGDVLYIPPFVFHAVTVVTPPNSTSKEAISVSVSVHTNCPEAELRAQMIDQVRDVCFLTVSLFLTKNNLF